MLTREEFSQIYTILIAAALAGAILGVLFANLGAATW